MIRSGKSNQGFTLLELVIVIALMGLVMFFTLPNFEGSISFNETDRFSRWLIMNVLSLKEKSVSEQKTYAMVFDLDDRTIQKVDDTIKKEEDEFGIDDDTRPGAYEWPEEIRIIDIQYPKKGKVTFGKTKIRFHAGGYSDKALIHVEDEDFRQITFIIEPFLSDVKRVESYIEFEN